MPYSSLMRAVAFGTLQNVEWILHKNPETLFSVDEKGRTALDWARMTRKMDIIAYLTQQITVYINVARSEEMGLPTTDGASIVRENAKQAQLLMEYIRARNSEQVLKLFAENSVTREAVADNAGIAFFADTETAQGDTPLILAAGFNMIPVVNELIAMGSPIDKTNKYGHTALTWACLCGHGEMVRSLLLQGANVEHQTNEGRTGLHYACLYAKARVVGVILDVMYERFGARRYKSTNPIMKFDPSRWAKYSLTLEAFLERCDGRADTALDLLPDIDPGTISKFISVKEIQSLCYSIIHIETGIHPEKKDLIELNIQDIGTKDSVARNLIKVVSADGSLLSNGRSEDRVSQDKHSRHSKASRVSSLASRDLVIDYESKSLKDHVSSIGSPGLAEEGSVFGSEIDGVNSNPIFTDAIVEVTETDGTKDDWGRFQLQNDSQFGSSVGNEHDNADALAEYELNMGSLLFQGGDYRAPYAELTNAVSKEVLSAEQSISGSAVGDSLFVFSPRDQKKFDDGEETAALKGFLTDAHSVRSVMSIDTEVGAILKAMAEAFNRIRLWRHCAQREAECNAPVPCWLGCGYSAKYALMCKHVGTTCPLRPVECPDCHEMQQANLLASHRKDCEKRFVACLNAWTGCREQIRFDYLDTHLNLRCQTRLVNCRLNCGAKVKFCLRVGHEQSHCMKRLIVCWQCQEDVMSEKITHHLHEACLSRLIRCTVGCGQMIEAREIEHHENEVCRQYCQWHCGTKFGPPEILRLHELLECQLRPMRCIYNCDMDACMTAGYVDEHMRHHCSHTPVVCPYLCAAGKLLRKDLSRHVDPVYGDCSERNVRCPSNYVGWRVLVHDRFKRGDPPAYGIVLKYKRFPLSSDSVAAELIDGDNFPPTIKWDGIDRLYIRFDNGQRWVNFWKNTITIVEKVTGDKISSKFALNEKFDCGFIVAGDLNMHLDSECRHRNVYIGAKVPPTAAEVEARIIKEAEEALIVANESMFSTQHSMVDFENRDRNTVDADDSDLMSVMSTNSHNIATIDAEAPKQKKFKKRNNSLFANKDMNDISYCVEINPVRMSQRCCNEVCDTKTFVGQQAPAKSSVQMAYMRQDINKFLEAAPDAVTCEHCSAEISPDRMVWHISRDCEHVLSRCGYGCGAKMIRRELPEHISDKCPKRFIICNLCSQQLWAEELETHIANQCSDRIIKCPLQCSDQAILAKDADQHMMESCVNRVITCLCGEKVVFREWPEHDVADCVKKLGQCPQGCGQRIPRDEMSEHMEKTCSNKHVWLLRPVKCPIGCGLRLKYIDILDHVSFTCSKRLLDCPYQCGNVVKYDKMAIHLRLCPLRQVTCEAGSVCCKQPLHLWFKDANYRLNRSAFNSQTGHWEALSFGEDMSTMIGSDSSIGPSSLIMGDNTYAANQLGGKESHAYRDQTFDPDNRIMSAGMPTANFEIPYGRDDVSSVNSADDLSRVSTIPPTDQLIPGESNYHHSERSDAVVISHSMTDTHSNVYNDTTDGVTEYRSMVPFIHGKGNQTTIPGRSNTAVSVDSESHLASQYASLGGNVHITHDDFSESQGVVAVSRQQTERQMREKMRRTGSKKLSTRSNRDPMKAPESSVLMQNGVICFKSDLTLNRCEKHQRTLLMYCIRYDDFVLANFALSQISETELDFENIYGDTALTLAARSNKLQFAELLLTHNANVNRETDNGRTALSEAVKEGHADMVEFLIENGANIMLKTNKHQRSAMDWGNKVGTDEIKRILKLGAMVQGQVKEIFYAIGCGDMVKVKALVEDGDFFGPQNITMLKERMENKLKLVYSMDKECLDKKQDLKAQKEIIAAISGRTKTAVDRLVAAQKALQDSILTQMENDKSMSSRFILFDNIAGIMVPRDVTEIALIRNPDDLVLHCTLAFGLLIGPTLEANKGHIPTKKSAKKWWPAVQNVLLDSAMTIKRIQLFSWSILLSPHSSELCKRLDELNIAIQKMITSAISEQQIRDQQREARRRVRVAEIALNRQQFREGKEKRRMEMIHESLELKRTERNAVNAAKARKKQLEDDLLAASRSQGMNDLTALLASGTVSPLKDLPKPPSILARAQAVDPLEWDSDAEGQGDGDWIGGEWVPKPFVKRKNWWRKDDEYDTDEPPQPIAKTASKIGLLPKAESSESIVVVMGGEARTISPPKRAKNNNIVFLSEPENKPLISSASTASKLQNKSTNEVAVVDVIAAGKKDDLDVAKLDVDEELHDAAITVILSDDEEEEKRKSEATHNLQFVQCISVLVKCCCSLIADLPSFRAAALEVTQKRKDLDDVVNGTASDITRSKTEELRKKIIEKEYSQSLDKKKETIKLYQKYKNKFRIARLLNQVTLNGHTAISYAAAVGNYDAVDILLSRGSPVGYTENLIHMSASVIQFSYRLYRCTYHGQKNKMLLKLKAKKAAKAKEEGKDFEKDELLAMLDYDENLTEQEITQAMAKKLDEEVMYEMKIGDDSFGSGEKIIEKMFELKVNVVRVLTNLKRLRSRHRYPVPEAAFGGHWEIVRRIYDRKLFHFRMATSWCSLAAAVPRPLPFLQTPHDANKSTKHYDLLELCNIALRQLGTTNSIPQIGWTPSILHHRSMFQESLNECTEVWRRVTEASDKFKAERHRFRILREDQKTKARNKQLMTRAIHSGNFYKCMELASSERSSIDFETASNLTALIVAAEENIGGLNHSFVINSERQPVLAVCYLLDRDFYKPVINLETDNGDTALLHACSQGRINVIEALLDRGADINRQNRFGQSSLHVAAKNGSVRCIKLLLERGADPTLKDMHGRIPSDIAFEMNFTDLTMVISQFRGGFWGPVAAVRGRVVEEIYCPTGCGTRLMPYEVKDHLLNCDQREIECPLGCGIRHLLKREEDEHLSTDCSERPILCVDCKQYYPLSQERNHLDNLCSMRLILCPLNCENNIPFSDLKKHFLFCPYRIIDCPNVECGERIPFVKKGFHLKNQCNFRKVSCPLRCLALVSFISQQSHVSTVCQLRPVKCKWCDTEKKFVEIQDHEKKCSKRGVDCTAGCGECVRELDLREHLLTACQNRFVSCELRCGQKVRLSDMESHMQYHCAHRLTPCPNGCYDSTTKDIRLVVAKRIDIHTSIECTDRILRCGSCVEDIKACDVRKHTDFDCSKRMVTCRMEGCSKQLPICDRERHELYKCKFRYISCENGCSDRVRVVHMKTHLARRCDMRYLKCPLDCDMQIRRRNMYLHLSEHCSKRNALFKPSTAATVKTSDTRKERRSKTLSSRVATAGAALKEDDVTDSVSLGSNASSTFLSAVGRSSAVGSAHGAARQGHIGGSKSGSRANTAEASPSRSPVRASVTVGDNINAKLIDQAIMKLLSELDGEPLSSSTVDISLFSETM